MPRFKANIKYDGTRYAGWQRQPNALTVQETLEEALSVYCKTETGVVGCGRTDAGVHARFFILHFDTDKMLGPSDIKGLNAILPDDIAMTSISEAPDDFHARFSCTRRSYSYYLHKTKDPFLTGRSYQFHRFHYLDLDKVDEAAAMIAQYDAFFPFCKSQSGVEHYKCNIKGSIWEWDEKEMRGIYRISANRFLRGMVRLLVGAQLNVGIGQLTLTELKEALDRQKRLTKDWSVPACGLFLDGLVYP